MTSSLPTEPELTIRAHLLAAGGVPMWDQFMDELREQHLDAGPRRDDGVLAELTRAYQRAVATGADLD